MNILSLDPYGYATYESEKNAFLFACAEEQKMWSHIDISPCTDTSPSPNLRLQSYLEIGSSRGNQVKIRLLAQT